MFRKGETYKIKKPVWTPDGITKDKMVKAQVEDVPPHGRFICLRFTFRGLFGEPKSYVGSFMVRDLKEMIKDGDLKRVAGSGIGSRA